VLITGVLHAHLHLTNVQNPKAVMLGACYPELWHASSLDARMRQVFNEFNARKIQDELNVFAGIWQSRTFLYISVITVAFQVLVPKPMSLAKQGRK